MDITDVGSYLSEIKEAIQQAIGDAETKEGEIEYKVEELGRVKDELEAARCEVEEVYNPDINDTIIKNSKEKL